MVRESETALFGCLVCFGKCHVVLYRSCELDTRLYGSNCVLFKGPCINNMWRLYKFKVRESYIFELFTSLIPIVIGKS